MTDPQHPFKIIWVNQQWCNLCGFQPEEVMGKTLNLLQQWSLFDAYNREKNIVISKDLMLELTDKLHKEV